VIKALLQIGTEVSKYRLAKIMRFAASVGADAAERLCKNFGACAGRLVPHILVFNIIQSYLNRESTEFFMNLPQTCDVKMKVLPSVNDVSIIHH
jgi:plasmid maintenance system antidote protein VapI